MPQSLTRKLIESHLIEGQLEPGEEIALRIDQTLTQDATGTLVMLELEAMGLDRVETEVSVQYVDHNLIQVDSKNPDDHLFLESCCRRYGIWYSPPGNGVSHPVHQDRFGKPGKTLLGSDSHTPAAGALGMLAIGAGGLEVAVAMAGLPFYVKMPRVWGVHLTGELPDWVSAKDVILEMLRRHDVDGGVGYVFEYFGPGLKCLSAMDRHVIANMGTELGATSTVFPADQEIQRYLNSQDRAQDYEEWQADADCEYDRIEELDLSTLEPLLALPSSPGNVVPVTEVAGQEIYQAYIGSSANPGYRDFAVAAKILAGRTVDPRVSLDINPTSRQLLMQLIRDGHLATLIASGGRLHQAGCNGCIGMGRAPATGKLSLRTVPRNFPGRSGAADDQVALVSPETAAASALSGTITDPRSLEIDYPRMAEPEEGLASAALLEPPIPPEQAKQVILQRGPNIVTLPDFDPLPDAFELGVLLKVGDHLSTDEILPAGSRVLPFRSNIPKIADFAFEGADPSYPQRARDWQQEGEPGHVVIAGENYGQGSSREHAALAPRYLGLRVVVAKGFARIHWQNLINFGILPLTFEQAEDYEAIHPGDRLRFHGLHELNVGQRRITIRNQTQQREWAAMHSLSARQIHILQAGGLINWTESQTQAKA